MGMKMDVIRVYVGATEQQLVPTKVLEWSIRKDTTRPVEVVPLYTVGLGIPLPRDARNRPRTPFSFQRFLIPAAAGYCGRAVYLDSDMVVLADLAELHDMPMRGGASLLAVAPYGQAGKQFSVMVMDCSRLRWDVSDVVRLLDDGRLTYEELMFEMPIAEVAATIPPRWNRLDEYVPGDTSLLHYTDMARQPWLARGHPWDGLWHDLLGEAVQAGFVGEALLDEHVARGWVLPPP